MSTSALTPTRVWSRQTRRIALAATLVLRFDLVSL
jgi:hypothetical protein